MRCRKGHLRFPSSVNGFTLVELLVVIVVITVLIAVLLPALGSARVASRRTVCLGQVRQIATAVQLYAREFNDHLPLLSSTDPGNQWAYQYQQLVLLDGFLASLDVFHCPDAVPNNTDMSGNFWPTDYATTINGMYRYTDYKLNDNINTAGASITKFRDQTWVVVTVDIDWSILPRHGEGENLAFLDGHAVWKDRDHYRDPLPTATDPYGNFPWYNWGL